MAGMGPFFSGALLLSFVILAVMAFKMKDRRLFRNVSLLVSVIFISVFSISETWWARFIPQLWLVPLIITLASEKLSLRWLKPVRLFMYVILAINTSFAFASFGYTLYKTEQIDYEMAQFRAMGKPLVVEWTYFSSNRARLAENHVPFLEKKTG